MSGFSTMAQRIQNCTVKISIVPCFLYVLQTTEYQIFKKQFHSFKLLSFTSEFFHR